MKKLFSLPEGAPPQARAALQCALIMFIGAIASIPLNTYMAFQQQVWQLYAIIGLCLFVSGATVLTWWLTRKGHHIAGMRILIGVLLLSSFVAVLLFANNIGSIGGVIIFVINLIFAIRTLPPRDLPRIVFIGLITLGAVILLDIFAPPTQLAVPQAGVLTPIIGGFVILAGTFFIAREFQNIPLASKLLLTFLAITIIPFFLLGFLLIQLTSQNLKDAAGNNLKTLAISQAVQVGGLIASEEESLRLLAINPIVHEQLDEVNASAPSSLEDLKQQEARWSKLPDSDPLVQRITEHPITDQLTFYIETIPHNLEVLATDKNGVVIASSRRPQHYYVADQDWWQGALDGGEEDVYISQPAKEHPDEPYSIWVAVPILEEDTGEILGVLRANYSMDALTVILEQETVGNEVGADLLLTEGQVYRAEGDIVTFDPETYANLEATADDPYGEFHYDEGIMLVSQSPVTTEDDDLAPAVEHLNWRLIYDAEAKEALASVALVTEVGVFSGLGVLLLVTLIALWLSRRISSPILKLTHAAQKISDGDLSAQATVSSTDEIGTLGTTFNMMTSRLRHTLEEVQQQAVTLQANTTILSRQALQLRAASEVSRTVSNELNSEGLIETVVELVRDRFELYYVGLFLIDAEHRSAVLSAGTGAAGREMLANGYQLEINEESMIGWSISHKEALVSQNTGLETAHFHNNPLLPNTRSELALPLIAQGQVIGAMTLQSKQESAFTPEDISILQTMADQLANSVEKARLYGQIQQRAIELERARTAADSAKEEADQARLAAESANRSLAAQMWQTAGQASLNEKMRGEQDITMLARNVIQQICKYVDVYSGVVYVLDEDQTLRLAGTYAYRRENPTLQYQIGEDLIGQAVVEKEIINNEIPDEYIALSLSQGKVLPKFRLIAPVAYNNEVSGVIVLESMSEFAPQQRRFVEQAIESVAIAFMTAQARARVDELFTQTRRQAEELQAQEEELRATNEELEAQTDSLRTSEARLKTNQAALEAANAELEENTSALREKQEVLDRQNQELREAQQELERKAEELTITNKYKSEFLANMSHELRTPLNSLLILSGILAKNEGGNLTPNQMESAQIIYASGSDLLQLINDILDLSKVEAGHMTFTFAPASLTAIAQDMQTQFEHVAQQRGLDFEITVADKLPESIVTDQQRVEQIIRNLLSNAIKFTEEGKVRFAIEPAPQKMIALRVSDSGIGMTAEQQQRVFEAFQQADGSTSRKFGGTGLGLTISREMTAKLGGRITLESELGKGSTFTLYLPLTPPETEAALTAEPTTETAPVADSTPKANTAPAVIMPREDIPPHTPSKPVIPRRSTVTLNDDRDKIEKGDKVLLVIEDDAKFAKVLLDYAHKKQFKAVLAGDGETGLKLATVYSPDAILLDLKLPGMSGWDVLDTLKGDASLRHIPVHILSAADQTMDAYKRGALGFLSKPISQPQLDEVFSTLGDFISRDIRSLLIVEDDSTLRHSVGQLLGGNDVEISEAASGGAALELLSKTHFDCMILDLTLPDMTGFELLSKINQATSISKCPIIVYTGKALTEDENAELLKYASSVIIKGVKSPERLLDETALFLHRVVADMPAEKQNTIRLLHDRDAVFSGKHILVVDDNMRNAFALSSLLNDKNLRVTIARSGMKALEMLDTIPDIDLVLMDIMMPEMDGYETMQRIRAQQQFKNLPILALTAKAMKGDLEKCIAAGANDYLSKPIDNDRLFSMLRVWLYR